jgi:hypothetical protein
MRSSRQVDGCLQHTAATAAAAAAVTCATVAATCTATTNKAQIEQTASGNSERAV